MTTSASYTAIAQELYVAYFGQLAEFRYGAGSGTCPTILAGLSARRSNLSRSSSKTYSIAPLAGLRFWSDALLTGSMTPGEAAMEIAHGIGTFGAARQYI
ncbi:MAG TPA: hypothetical protein VF798_12940 [Burkholderiaceae bacterium]